MGTNWVWRLEKYLQRHVNLTQPNHDCIQFTYLFIIYLFIYYLFI